MASLNRVTLIGRLTDNPEPPRTLPNTGNRVVKFRFAVGRSKKNQQTGQWENDPNPLYIDCEAFTRENFTRLVDVITNYCKKGSQILVEGQLRLDTWDDKTTGQKRSKHKIVVDNIELLDTRGADSSSEVQGRAAPTRSMSNAGSNSGGNDFHEESPPQEGGDNIPF
ncbi:MAG TPA: single-stranded DNA-binding protein [Gemmataceae bacterium]|jgi:single-strand DNA-binding protein|nr:single-stranded DNA-binding protein [Gemmataceae bacterium]